MWFSRRNAAFQNKFSCFCPFLLARHWPTQTALVRSVLDAYPFSKPVKPNAATSAQWRMTSYTYEYHEAYGGPELDEKELGKHACAIHRLL